MKAIKIFIVCCLLGLGIQVKAQNCGPIAAPELRRILVELGYTVKDLNTTVGKEKYEVKLVTTTLDVPMGFEISPSTNFIWLTVFLGKPFEETSPKNIALLKRNAIVQPCQFYITEKGNLMMGMALENRAVTNAVLKKFSDNLAKKVSDNQEYWKQN
jgi:hypothetical protein